VLIFNVEKYIFLFARKMYSLVYIFVCGIFCLHFVLIVSLNNTHGHQELGPQSWKVGQAQQLGR